MTSSATVPDARNRQITVVVAAVGLHFALAASHVVAHLSIPVPIADWQGAYAAIALVGVPVPVAGAAYVLRGSVRRGAWLLVAGGVGALGFETLAHFAFQGHDHVVSVATGRALFAGTATLSVVGDALIVAAGAWVLRSQTHGSSTRSWSDSTT